MRVHKQADEKKPGVTIFREAAKLGRLRKTNVDRPTDRP
jgi:hypothetical protein